MFCVEIYCKHCGTRAFVKPMVKMSVGITNFVILVFTALLYNYIVILGPPSNVFFSTSVYFLNGNTKLMSDLTYNQFYPSAERIWLCIRLNNAGKQTSERLIEYADFGKKIISVQFLSTLSIMYSCISPMALRILSFKASIVSGLSA